jgi:lysozyme
MAKKLRARARRAPRRWLVRFAGLLVLFGLAFAAWLWWDMRDWRPDPARYPEQGALVPVGTAPVRFETLRAIGARFVYLPLAMGPAAQAPGGFADRFAAARAAGLRVGVVLPFDPCRSADAQSGMFAQMVPRDPDLLPPRDQPR